MLVFEWDENKNKLNQKKYGISFDEARTVFYDEAAIVFDNP
ncbi:BrnT family toxin [Amygdalobacter nucleatus]|uniref:Putative toxin-antitoxin system, toxin component n=1 Tax=Amygdalobacter nucleatus TaxID=3029274 RepID=A0A133YGC5_9FIRM|nr:BrnT family toxin [Amygdalobacter nucleatus]KXB42244.1 putative toxin-antitoxin system, toxin component [Amygdalobacter nucleatus]